MSIKEKVKEQNVSYRDLESYVIFYSSIQLAYKSTSFFKINPVKEFEEAIEKLMETEEFQEIVKAVLLQGTFKRILSLAEDFPEAQKSYEKIVKIIKEERYQRR